MRPAVRLPCICLVALLTACGVELPLPTSAPTDAAAADAAAADVILADAAVADDAPPSDVPVRPGAPDVPTATDGGADAGVTCANAVLLSDARHAVHRNGAFVLRDVAAARVTAPRSCASDAARAGYSVVARFTSSHDTRWRFHARGLDIVDLSLLEDCRGDAPGARLRCTGQRTAPTTLLDTPSVALEATLRAGQRLVLVARCASETVACTADLSAEPIDDHGCFDPDTPCAPGLACVWRQEGRGARGVCTEAHAPTLRDVRVFRVGAALGTVLDVDGDAHTVFAELLDRGGAVTPHRGNPRLQGSTAVLDVARQFRWTLGNGYPMPDDAVRARLWLRDAAGLESAPVEVPIESATVLPEGALCTTHTSEPFTRITACAPGTLCLGGAAAPRCLAQRAPTLTRLAAWHDPLERVLSLDLDAHDPDHDIGHAEVYFLDAEGRSLPGESFQPYSAWRNVRPGLEGTFVLDERGVPDGTRRVRVRVGDAFGLWSAFLEVTPTTSVTLAPGEACDPASTARRRCERAAAYCLPLVGERDGRCQTYEPACPRYWNATRWAPPAAAGTYTVDGASSTWSTPRVSCLEGTDRAGFDRVGFEYELVAPRTGTYRIALEVFGGGSRYALALRAFCGGPALDAELACAPTVSDTGTTHAAITRALQAGERVMVVVTGIGGLRHRLSLTVP